MTLWDHHNNFDVTYIQKRGVFTDKVSGSPVWAFHPGNISTTRIFATAKYFLVIHTFLKSVVWPDIRSLAIHAFSAKKEPTIISCFSMCCWSSWKVVFCKECVHRKQMSINLLIQFLHSLIPSILRKHPHAGVHRSTQLFSSVPQVDKKAQKESTCGQEWHLQRL